MHEVIDNFIEQRIFDDLSNQMITPQFPWYPSNIDTDDHERNALRNMQFVHYFYENNMAMDGCQMVFPILQKLDPIAVLRIKANITLQHDTQLEHDMHVDITNTDEPFVKIAILYMNTCNGYTLLEDGTKINSVANRLVKFPNSMKHTSCTCSDQTYRMVINFNYI